MSGRYQRSTIDPRAWSVVPSYERADGGCTRRAVGPWQETREEAERDAEHGSMRGALPEVHPGSLTTIIDVLDERSEWVARAVRAERALAKVDAIRNSIVGSQTVNWSEHVYPLVAALANVGTLLERITALEAERNRAREAAHAAFTDLRDLALACEMRDDECYRDAIERRLSELTSKANELPGLTATLDDLFWPVSRVRSWHERYADSIPLHEYQALASILDDAPTDGRARGAK